MKRFTISIFVAAIPALSWGVQQERVVHVGPKVFAWKGTVGGYLGVQVLDLTPELRRHFGVPEDSGVLVSRVEDGSPAEAAGILVGDVLTAVDGERVPDFRGLWRSVRDKDSGETVSVELRRGSSTLSLPVVVEERDRPAIDLAEFQMKLPSMGSEGIFIAGPGPLLDEEAVRVFEESMKDIEKRFESEEWQDRLKRIQEMDLTKVQERMREVEERLRKLEQELESESKKKKDE
jgi:membrane-associated protease RseP (regulator of RpoE activity)